MCAVNGWMWMWMWMAVWSGMFDFGGGLTNGDVTSQTKWEVNGR